jgi:catalase
MDKNRHDKAQNNVIHADKKQKKRSPHRLDQKKASILTTVQGVAVSDNQNSLRIGSKGPTILEDFPLREKLFHFDHERIPERVVHARGFGVHGFYENYQSLAKYTYADLFQRPKEQTPVFVRFSTVVGNKGSADLARDVRGFAVKFYTKAGNWDLVGNNIPVFFIQDAIKFPDLIHAAKDEPDRGFPQAQTAHDNFWDFISLTPETMHMVLWIMSDRAIPRSFRFMEGFGVHTFRFINAAKKSILVKFHWKPKLGLQSVTWNEAVRLNGIDPDFHRRDLWDAIHCGHFPEWELGLQLFEEAQADEFLKKFQVDVLDATKLIPEELVPIKKVGRLVLNRCVDNFFAETEQVAFCTQNIVPGIDFTNDPLLQGRNFSYLDTQLKRLGSPNFNTLPINAAKCPVHTFHQDGHMAFANPTGRANYEPNSWGEGPRESLKTGFKSYASEEQGQKIRARSESFADHYSQARLFYKSQTPIEQQHIQDAFTFELSKVASLAIRARVVSHLLNVDVKLAEAVANKLGLQTLPTAAKPLLPRNDTLQTSAALSILLDEKRTFKGRILGVVLAENTDIRLVNKLKNALKKEETMLEIITPTVGGVTLKQGGWITGQQSMETAHAVCYDALAILLDAKDILDPEYKKKVCDFIHEGFVSLKFIAYSKNLFELFAELDLKKLLDEGFIALESANDCQEFIKHCRKLRVWSRITTGKARQLMPKV